MAAALIYCSILIICLTILNPLQMEREVDKVQCMKEMDNFASRTAF